MKFSIQEAVERRQPLQSPLISFARFRWSILLSLLIALSSATSAEVRSDRWRWSNPLPHGNNVLDMLATSELAIQVGDGGSLHVQRLDERWAPAITGVTNYLRSVALLGERIIATGENGCIIWSDDGNTFNPAQLSQATTDWIEGVAASSQRAVAVGDNGSIYTSTNGIAWTKASSGTAEWLRGVAAGNGAFVAVGEDGMILRSTNGTSWSPIASGTSAHLNRVRYLGTGGSALYVAVGNGGVAMGSTTGTAPWTPLASGTTNNLFDVALNEAGMLLVGDQEVRFRATGDSIWSDQITMLPTNAPPAWVYLSACGRSTNWLVAGRAGLLMEGSPINSSDYEWQPSPDSPHAWLWDVAVQNGIYVAVGDLANIQTSLDGILWASEVVPVPHTNTVLLGVGGTTNLLIAVGNAGNVLISRAGYIELTNTLATAQTFGVVWTNLPPFTTNTLQGIAASDNLFIASGDAGRIFTSPNGTNWTERSTPTANFLSGVAIGPSACVAVGAGGMLLRAGADGETWTQIPMGTDDWLYRVRWLDGQFMVVGQNGRIYTSPNGSDWTPRTSGTVRWLTDATFVDGQWFVTGYQGTLLTSTNLANWTLLPLPTIKSLFAATAHDGQLVVAGIEGVILRNRIVPQVSPVDFLDYSQIVAENPDSITDAYELFLFGGMPDQFFEFQSTTNLSQNAWMTNATLELFDPSGTIYLLRTRSATNTPAAEFYRTQLLP